MTLHTYPLIAPNKPDRFAACLHKTVNDENYILDAEGSSEYWAKCSLGKKVVLELLEGTMTHEDIPPDFSEFIKDNLRVGKVLL